MRFQGKSILVTGGARGIGLTTALMMLAEGGRVGVMAMTPEHLRKAAETARARDLPSRPIKGTSPSQIRCTAPSRRLSGRAAE